MNRGNGALLAQPKLGIVSAVDPVRNTVRVTLQPEGVETGDIPAPALAAGVMRIVVPLEIGTHVTLMPIDGDAEHYAVTSVLFDAVVQPPISPATGQPAQPGEFLILGGQAGAPQSDGTTTPAQATAIAWQHVTASDHLTGANQAKTTAPITRASGNLMSGTGFTGATTSPTGDLLTYRHGLLTNILPSNPSAGQASALIDTGYLDNVIAAVNGINVCADLQELESLIYAAIQAHIVALENQIENLLPLKQLLDIPHDLQSIITWIGKLIAAQIAPGYSAYLNAVQQLAALVEKVAQLTAAIAAAAARIGECVVTVPAIVLTPPPSPPAPVPSQ